MFGDKLEREILQSWRTDVRQAVGEETFAELPRLDNKTIAKASALIKAYEAVDPETGILLLDRQRHVIWANQHQKRLFEKVAPGKLCFTCYNFGFESACRWCNMDRALQNGDSGAVISHALSPQDIADPDSEPVYSDLIHVPIPGEDGAGPQFLLELVKIVTPAHIATAEAERTSVLALSRLGSLIVGCGSTEDVYDLILLGPFLYLDAHLARTSIQVNSVSGEPVLVGTLDCATESGRQDARKLRMIDKAREAMNLENPPTKLNVGEVHSAFRRLLTTENAKAGFLRLSPITDDTLMDRLLRNRLPQRIHGELAFRAAACHIDDSGEDRDLFVTIDLVNDSDFLAEQDLTSFFEYCSFVERILEVRALQRSRLRTIERYVPTVSEIRRTGEGLHFWGMAVLSNAHEIISCRDRMVRSLSSIPRTSDISKDIQFPLEEAREALDSYKRAFDNVRDATELARPLNVRRTEIGSLCATVATGFKADSTRAGVEMEVRGPTDRKGRHKSVYAKVDPAKLRVVLENLVSNALRALSMVRRQGKAIRLEFSDSDGDLALVVEDNGPGFSKLAEGADIFDPFVTTRTVGGIGLGLTIVKRVVSEHNGSVSASNVKGQGKGARFDIRLPSCIEKT